MPFWLYIYITINIPGKPYGQFCPLWVLPVTDVFFGSIAYFGFWLWRVVQVLWQQRVRTSSDSLQKRNFSPKWRKLGVVIGYPNLATNTAIFPTKIPCTHKTLVFFQHHVENKTVSRCQHTAPNTVSRRDTHTVGTSPMNPRFQENYWSEGLQPGMAVFGKKNVTDKNNGQTRTDRKCCHCFPGIYYIIIYYNFT